MLDEGGLQSLIVTKQDVIEQIEILDINKSYGPDLISPVFLKQGIKEIAEILTYIFNKCLLYSRFASVWKKASVIPLHKKDSKDNVSNYRPVSLLSTVGKVFERIIFKHVFNFFRDKFVLSDIQTGF